MIYQVEETYTVKLSRSEVDILLYALETMVKEALKNGDYTSSTMIANLKDIFYKMITNG